MPIELKIARDVDAPVWDALVTDSVHGTLFHTWRWLKIAEKHTQMRLYPLMGMKDNTPIAIFPLFLQRKGPLNLVFSPPPKTVLFYLGPAFAAFEEAKQERQEKTFLEFQGSVDEFLKDTLHPHYTRISLSPHLQDPRPFLWSGYSIDTHYDYVIDLNREPKGLLKLLTKKQRQNITHALHKGMTVEIGGSDELEKILTLMEIRYKGQGKSARSHRDYLLDIYDAYKDYIKIFVAKINDEIVSGTVDFQYKDVHYSWIGNPKPKDRIIPSPNDLIIWESVRFAKETGMKYYVTMNAAGNERLHSYYASKYNPEISVHFSLKKSNVWVNLLEKGYGYILE